MLKELHFENHGVLCIFDGHTSLSDVLQAVETVGIHPNFERIRFIVYDFSTIESFTYDVEYLIKVASQMLGMTYTNSVIKSAYVARREDVVNAVTEYCTLSKRYFERFNSTEDALAWGKSL